MPRCYHSTLISQEFLQEPRVIKTVNHLIDGTYSSSDVERLQGHRDIYSIRINDTERLLFTFWELNGKRYLVVLEHLPTHDYDGSRFLQRGFLKKYKILHQEAMEEAALRFEAEKEPLPTITAVEGPTKPLMDYQQQWIHLSDEQFEAVHTTLPALIQGPAGSGKSCVAFSILENYLESHRRLALDEADPAESILKKRLLYVTKSTLLTDKLQALWLETHSEDDEFEVHFKTYDELLAEHQPDPSKSIKAYKEVLQGWIEKTKIKINKEILHQEFLICSTYSQAEYLQLGARQSLLHNPEDRKALYEAYLRFVDFLRQNHIALDTLEPFKTPSLEEQYDIVVADESQDLSNWQRCNLIELSKEKINIAFLMDMNQDLNGLLTSSFFLKDYFYKSHGRPILNEVQLSTCYRCPPAIAHWADKIIKAKNNVTGGLADSKEAAEILTFRQEALGQVIQIAPEEIPSWEWLQQQHQQAHCAIITSEEFLEEASQFFPRERLFTAESIKGLEYDVVILYKPFSDRKLLDAIKLLPPEWDDRQAIRHRPRQGSANTAQALPFNHLFTAITRAKQTLILCDTKHHDNELLLNPIQGFYKTYKEIDESQLEQHVSSVEEWRDEIKRLYLLEGDTLRLKALFKHHVCPIPQSFQDFIQALQAQATPLITAQVSLVRSEAKPLPPKIALKPAPKPNPKVVAAKAPPATIKSAIFSAQSTSRISGARPSGPRFRKKETKTFCLPLLTQYSGPDLLEVFQKSNDENAINLLFSRLNCLYNEEYNILFHLVKSQEKDYLIKGLIHLNYAIQQLPRKKEQMELQLINLLLSNDYILLLLSQTPEGARYISELFERPLMQSNMDLKARFFKTIYRVHTYPAHLQNSSVLFFLLRNAGFQAKFLIAMLFTHLEEGNLYRKEAFRALCALRQSEPEEKTQNMSPLYWLCKLKEWHPQIIRLINHPNLYKKEDFIHALCARLTAKAEHYENYSPIFWLCYSEELLPSVIEFIEKNRLFERKVFQETLCARITQNASLLFWLCNSRPLRPVILNFIKDYKLFENKDFKKAFFLKENATPLSDNVSVFYLFCESPELHLLLLSLFKEANIFHEEEFKQALCARRTSQAGRFENISPIYLLSIYSALPVMTLWVKNPELLTRPEFIDAIFAQRNAEAEEYQGSSVVSLLCNHPQTREDMRLLLRNPTFIENPFVQRFILRIAPRTSFFQTAKTKDLDASASPAPS